jgi:methoxymalonate biosynthesis protein
VTANAAAAPRLAVIGAGVMGTGIATLAVGWGVPVVLVDVDEETLTRARAGVAAQLRLAAMMAALPPGVGAADLTTTTDLARIRPVTAVIESVTEQPALKAKVLAEVSGAVGGGTLVVSNTSAIPIDEMADSVLRPENFLGVHFMNPPYLITTVELVRGGRTGEAAITAATSLLSSLGREAVVVGDGPGFVINRILQRVINEAARVVEEGVATPEAVDALFTRCLGHRTGPLGTADIIGLDNVVDSLHVLFDRTGDPGYRPSALLMDKVRAGDLGQKAGRGFFDHGGAR